MSGGFWFNENYKFRVPVSVNFSVEGTKGNYDVEVEIPSDWNIFWANVRSDLKDVVITSAKGDLLVYNFKSGFNYANKDLTLEIEAVNLAKENSMVNLFLYFANANETIDRRGTVSMSSPKTGKIELAAPFGRIVTPSKSRPTVNTPETSFTKSSLEKIDIFFSVAGLLAPRIDAFNKKMNYEEIEYVQVQAFQSNGEEITTLYKLSATTFVSGFVKVRVEGGTTANDFAISLQIKTTTGQQYDIRCLILVRDLLP